MKKTIYTLLLLFIFCKLSIAQVDSVYYGTPTPKEKKKGTEKPPINWKENTSFGGNFMVWFGSNTYIYLSPTVNYALSKRLNVGVGGIYNYISSNSSVYHYTYTVYGLHSYALYYLTNNVFAQVQYDYLRQPNLYSPFPNEKVWLGYFYVGGGFRQPLGDHAALYTSVLYNLTQSRLSVYPNPMIQIGILAGF